MEINFEKNKKRDRNSERIRKTKKCFYEKSFEDIEEVPEKRLVRAIVERAILDSHGVVSYLYPSSDPKYKHSQKKQIQKEALAWLASNNKEPFSFLWCLDVLDVELSASEVRQKIKDLKIRGLTMQKVRFLFDRGSYGL